MKKQVASALAAALAVGMASTTFAAANPFVDVPADHWSYDAIAQLAADGVTSGYGDGTFRGQQEITRYEMAVMVAKAMAKSGLSETDRAMLDKLSVEFGDELKSLGVRVAALEKKVDNVKWPGEVRYRFHRVRKDGVTRGKDKAQWVRFRVNPVMQINKNWTGHSRVDYDIDTKDAKNTQPSTDRIWVQGKYGNTLIQLGKFVPSVRSDYGLTMDWLMAGGRLTFGKDVMVSLGGGRLGGANYKTKMLPDTKTVNYQGIEIYNNRKNKFTWGLGYQRVASEGVLKPEFDKKSIGIWDVGLGYKFTKDVELKAAYARGQADKVYKSDGSLKNNFSESKQKQAYSVELDYGKLNRSKPGSYKLFVAYRHMGEAAVIKNTYSVFEGWENNGTKGFEVGGFVTLDKNIVGELVYINGKYLTPWTVNGEKKDKFNTIWSQVHFYF